MSKAEDKLENKRLKYIDYTFKRHGIDPDSKEGQLIYYAYGHGYRQAMRDVIDWIDNNWREYVNVDADGVVCFGHWKNDLRKAIEDET